METWFANLNFFDSPHYDKIVTFLAEECLKGKEVFPPEENILDALQSTPLDMVKVVILGQDPYPTPGHAHGLSFSVKPDINPLPKSLQNIFRELEDDIGVKRECGCLVDWAMQGVLLLNTSLTVESGSPQSHSEIGWTILTNEIIKLTNEQRENVVFILWGKHAQKKSIYISKKKHLILEAPHPSPLSASRGFFGSKPFSQTNAYLIEHGQEPIHWA